MNQTVTNDDQHLHLRLTFPDSEENVIELIPDETYQIGVMRSINETGELHMTISSSNGELARTNWKTKDSCFPGIYGMTKPLEWVSVLWTAKEPFTQITVTCNAGYRFPVTQRTLFVGPQPTSSSSGGSPTTSSLALLVAIPLAALLLIGVLVVGYRSKPKKLAFTEDDVPLEKRSRDYKEFEHLDDDDEDGEAYGGVEMVNTTAPVIDWRKTNYGSTNSWTI